MIILLMGVSGSGKTEIGEKLAPLINGVFLDADDFHSEANKRKMDKGTPLTDEDRAPWLATLRRKVEEYMDSKQHMILACSLLKMEYRYQIRVDQRTVKLVFLDRKTEDLVKYVQERDHEFFDGVDMLVDQLCTLEKPEKWEDAYVMRSVSNPDTAAARIKKHYDL